MAAAAVCTCAGDAIAAAGSQLLCRCGGDAIAAAAERGQGFAAAAVGMLWQQQLAPAVGMPSQLQGLSFCAHADAITTAAERGQSFPAAAVGMPWQLQPADAVGMPSQLQGLGFCADAVGMPSRLQLSGAGVLLQLAWGCHGSCGLQMRWGCHRSCRALAFVQMR